MVSVPFDRIQTTAQSLAAANILAIVRSPLPAPQLAELFARQVQPCESIVERVRATAAELIDAGADEAAVGRLLDKAASLAAHDLITALLVAAAGVSGQAGRA